MYIRLQWAIYTVPLSTGQLPLRLPPAVLSEHAAPLIVGNKIEKFCRLTVATGFRIHLECLNAGERLVVAVASLENVLFSGRQARSPPNFTLPLFPRKLNSVTSVVCSPVVLAS